MVDWKNPNVIAYVFFLYERIAVVLVGFYGTHFVNTCYVEWELVRRKRAFRLVHVPFLLARYITLAALLFFVISGRVKDRIACDPAYRIFASLGSMASMLASLIICSRPIAIFWTLRYRVPLFALKFGALVQGFLVVCQGVWTVRARWDAAMGSCTVVTWDTTFLAVFYLYTSVFDVLILLATLWAVRRVHAQQPWGVGSVLCVQGIGYVAATAAANLPVAVLAFLDLNAGMDVLLSQPAMTVGVIASSLAFLGLEDAAATAAKSKSKPKAPPRAALSGSGSGSGDADPESGFGSAGFYSSAGAGVDGLVSTHIPLHLSAMGADSVPDFVDLDLDPECADKPRAVELERFDAEAGAGAGTGARGGGAGTGTGIGAPGPARGPEQV